MEKDLQTYQTVFNSIKQELTPLYDASEAESIAHILFEQLLTIGKSNYFFVKDTKIPNLEYETIKKALEQLKKSVPVQYVTGKADFFNLVFAVNPSVLIPRQETEQLVQLIIDVHKRDKAAILDIGTGSGCIAIALKRNIPQATITAVDISEEALKTASNNAKELNAEITFRPLDILEPEAGLPKFDVIVSNPPYIKESEKSLMHKNVLNYEPHEALFVPDNDLLKFYKAIVQFSLEQLNPEGFIYFEINEAHALDVYNLLDENNFTTIEIIKDINEKSRIAWAQL